MSEDVFDPGLQPERTALAWQRTLLSLTVAFLAASRGLLPVLGVWSYTVAGIGVALSLALAVVTHRRYRRIHVHLTTVHPHSLPHGGALMLVCCCLALLCGALALAFTLHGML